MYVIHGFNTSNFRSYIVYITQHCLLVLHYDRANLIAQKINFISARVISLRVKFTDKPMIIVDRAWLHVYLNKLNTSAVRYT